LRRTPSRELKEGRRRKTWHYEWGGLKELERRTYLRAGEPVSISYLGEVKDMGDKPEGEGRHKITDRKGKKLR